MSLEAQWFADVSEMEDGIRRDSPENTILLGTIKGERPCFHNMTVAFELRNIFYPKLNGFPYPEICDYVIP